MTQSDYLSCVETAKLVRAALKKAFSGTKFSVRSDSYAGGASIHVGYVDGPLAAEVEKVAGKFAGAGFDGSIDLKYHHAHYLCPDGVVYWATTYGHSYDNGESARTLDDLPEGTRLVHFGADYVFVNRAFSPERETEIKAEIATAAGVAEFNTNAEYDVAIIDGEAKPCGYGGFHPHRYGDNLFRKLAATKDYAGKGT